MVSILKQKFEDLEAYKVSWVEEKKEMHLKIIVKVGKFERPFGIWFRFFVFLTTVIVVVAKLLG